MGITKLILKFAVPLPRIENYSRYLFIGPHPDDIEIGAGATAARLAASGKQVCFLVCTDGRFGDGNAPEGCNGQALIDLRKQEAIRSAAALGVTDVRFLGLSDGGFYSFSELEEGIARVIADFQPDIIFAPDPCVTSECHKDHLNVGNAAKPTRFVGTRGFVKKQLPAIFDNHISQFPKGSSDAASIRLYLNLRSIGFGLRSLKGRAEGFRVLGTTHMHCLPEAEK